MTARVGRAAADEQERNRRVHPDSDWCRFLSQISRAPERTDLQRTATPGHSTDVLASRKKSANYSVAIQLISSQPDGNAGVIAGPGNEGTAVKLAVKLPSK
jgi:hypothetical protein